MSGFNTSSKKTIGLKASDFDAGSGNDMIDFDIDAESGGESTADDVIDFPLDIFEFDDVDKGSSSLLVIDEVDLLLEDDDEDAIVLVPGPVTATANGASQKATDVIDLGNESLRYEPVFTDVEFIL